MGDLTVLRKSYGKSYLQYAVLGTMLGSPENAGRYLAMVSEVDFDVPQLRRIYRAISDLHGRGIAPEAPAVVELAEREDRETDYKSLVVDCFNLGGWDSSMEYYTQLLKQSTRLSRIQEEARSILETDELGDAMEAVDRINGVVCEKNDVRIIGASEAARDFCDRQVSEKPEYLTWGMKELDEKLYAQLGDFVVVGGYPSAGKTLLSIQFALGLAKKYRVGYFSLETSPQKLIDRLMSHMAQVPLAKIKERNLNEAEWAALIEAGSALSSLTMECVDAGGMSVRDIQAVALNRRYQVICVDYLQLIASNGKSRYEEVTAISQGLHTLARSNNIAVIALAQLSRPEKTKNSQLQIPTLSSFRESGQIEQDADIAFLLWPSDPNDNHSNRVLKVAKNKEGERLKMELIFDGACQTMKVAPPTKAEQYRKVHKEIREAGKMGRKPADESSGQVTFQEIEPEDGEDVPF